ncbi:MAG: stage III sporulation protein AB [Clostridiales bacterium]|nr:stage III sporulation protein AB [Clostridiales bacterium]
MQITKVVGCILIILSSTLMGFYCSNELKTRINDIKELRKLVVLLRGDIRYGNTPLPEAICAIARRHEGSLKGFFTKVAERLSEHSGNTFSQIWKEAVDKELNQTSLNKKDKSNLIQFGENLGYLDKEMQMNTLDLFLTQIEEEISELSKTAKEKSYLYNTLGIMAGIFISIILI